MTLWGSDKTFLTNIQIGKPIWERTRKMDTTAKENKGEITREEILIKQRDKIRNKFSEQIGAVNDQFGKDLLKTV